MGIIFLWEGSSETRCLYLTSGIHISRFQAPAVAILAAPLALRLGGFALGYCRQALPVKFKLILPVAECQPRRKPQ